MNLPVKSLGSIAAVFAIGAIAFYFAMDRRATAAQASLRMAQAEADKAEAEEKRTRNEASAKKAEADRARDEAKRAENTLKAKQASEREAIATAEAEREANQRSQHEAAAAADRRKTAEAEAQKASLVAASAKSEAARAAALREETRLKAQAEEDRRRGEEAALERKKIESERLIAEAKLRELRLEDLRDYERELVAIKRDLDEREAALRPEKTVADLAHVSLEDTVFDGQGKVVKRGKRAYRAEDDQRLTRGERLLARANRLATLAADCLVEDMRSNAVARLTALRDAAVARGDLVDARHCADALRALYPDRDLDRLATDGEQPAKPEKEEIKQ